MAPTRFRQPLVALRRLTILPAWVRRMDARAAHSINRHHRSAMIDAGLMRLSRIADRGFLWLGISAALAVLGQPSRSGAFRGLASLGVASVLANLIGKEIFGGDRPLLKDVPIGRRLKKPPKSPSFPSGHTASAAAFVTGVALESRGSGAALAPLGAAVAYSRVHTGAHWLSDVLGGAVLGVAVAVLGKIVFRGGMPTGQPEAPGLAPTIELPALAGGEGALIFVNSSSGVDLLAQSDPLDQLGNLLPRADLRALEDVDDLGSVVRDALASNEPPRALGIYGGDGSVAAVADVARDVHLPLIVFPGGTFNHFARVTGSVEVESVVRAVQSGTGLRVDVAELTQGEGPGMTVLNAASVGVYPDFVAEREKHEDRFGKPVASLVAAMRVLARANLIDVTVDGRGSRVWSVSIGVGGNSSSSMVPLGRRRLDDGVLDVRVLHARGRLRRIRGVVALAFGGRASGVLDRFPRTAQPTIEAFTTDAVRVEIHEGTDDAAFARDGEVSTPSGPRPTGGYVAAMRIVPGALGVYSCAPLADQE